MEYGTRYYDREGNLTRRVLRYEITGAFINPLMGATVPWTQHEIHTSVSPATSVRGR